MKLYDLDTLRNFSQMRLSTSIVHDSCAWRVLTFNFEAGQELPVHSHPVDSEVALLVLEGQGVLTGGEVEILLKPGSLAVSPVSEPHGIRAATRMRVLVLIAPPL
jgi:quercetin dioxygenase-like cupin family protein